MPPRASRTPSTPPASASTRLSESSVPAICPRLAPSAVRTANSCCRVSARTRHRFATLAHAMSSTMPTVPNTIQSRRLTSPMMSSDSGCTFGPSFKPSYCARVNPGGSGNASGTSGSIRATSALAWATVMPGFSRATRLIAEVADERLGPIELLRHQDLGIRPQERERPRQHADDFRRLARDGQRLSDDGAAAELPLPVAPRQHHRVWRARHVVGVREDAAGHRHHAEDRQEAVGHEQRPVALGFAPAGDRHRAGVPQADVLEDAALLSVDEVGGRAVVQLRDAHTRRRVPDAHEPVGLGKRQRLQEHAVDDAENRGVRADAYRQRDQRDDREERRLDEAADGERETGPGHMRSYDRVSAKVSARAQKLG